MKVVIPVKEAVKFAEQITTDSYRKEERNYKVAVHRVLSALLSQENIGRDDFPSLVSNVFKEPLPDLGALGIAEQKQDFIKAACATQGAGALRSAMANLAGGKGGLAQFIWIPRAIEFGLGEPIADAFRGLIDAAVQLPQRVETFRDKCDSIGLALEKKGGFLPTFRSACPGTTPAGTVASAQGRASTGRPQAQAHRGRPRRCGRGSSPGQRGGILMADQYKCKKCGKTSSKPGNCCGGPMEKVR